MDKKPYFQALQPWNGGWGWINKESLTEEIVRKWWETFPEAQIALKCGRESGITVIDIDWLKNPEDGQPDVQGSVMPDELAGNLPASLMSTTGRRGKHIFYRFACVQNSAKKLHPQMDIRSEGGYIILPPSIHGNGNGYEWDEDSPWSEEALENLTSFPMQCVGLADPRSPVKRDWGEVIRGVSVGQRNETAASLSGILVCSLAPRIAWDILTLWNDHRNNPPLSTDELQKTFLSILRREYAKRAKHGSRN